MAVSSMPAFFAMTAHYLFEPDFCNVASGWEKGIVEKNVQDARRRVWIEAKTQCFSSFAELNLWLDARCRACWLAVEHPDYAGITVAEVLEQEQVYLMPMPIPFDGYVELLARVSSTCLVTVDRHQFRCPVIRPTARPLFDCMPIDWLSVPNRLSWRVIHACCLVIRSVTTGSTIFR